MQVLYGSTLFLSALLLFLAQPMFGKLALPLLGGTSAVWNTCLAFFQVALLAGYVYAHLSARWLNVRLQTLVHVSILAAPLAVMPLAIPDDWTPPSDRSPVPWLLGLMLLTVGPPCLVLSATAPLLQAWFARARQRGSADPYFLYAASNAGSMLALIGFPLAIEPTLSVREQARVWAGGYALLLALVSACAWGLFRAQRNADTSPHDIGLPRGERLPLLRQLRWWALSLAPCSWLLGVTAHLTSSIAPIPLLWVAPLGIYLVTFILVFARHPPLSHSWMLRLTPATLLLLVLGTLLSSVWLLLALHLAAFFVGAMACHGELAADRPPPAHLTRFYLWMSLGGACGGALTALIAPLLFPRPVEYPLALSVACLLCVPAYRRLIAVGRRTPELALAAVLALAVAVMARGLTPERPVYLVLLVVAALPALLLLLAARLPLLFTGILAVALTCDKLAAPFAGEVLFAGRGYFGQHWVIANHDIDGSRHYHHLVHGVTVHGRQRRDKGHLCEPLVYYHRTGPLGQAFAALDRDGAGRRVGIVGLGAGAAACYARPGREFTFFEIDPLVASIATTSPYFSFLSDCAKDQHRIVLGDGRLKLAEAKPAAFDLILLDAFSSDTVPIHLLTREALQIYLSRLAEGGMLVFHASNTHLDLETVLANLAADGRLECFGARQSTISPTEFALGKTPSTYVVMARRLNDLHGLDRGPGWRRLLGQKNVRPWTDDYSNIVGALRWGNSQ